MTRAVRAARLAPKLQLQQLLESRRPRLGLLADGEVLAVGVVGGSMGRGARPGECVRVRRCGYLWPGDVALFSSEAKPPVLHRVLVEIPWLQRIIHAGDAGGLPGIAPRRSVVGRADLPRRPLAAWTPRRARQLLRLLARCGPGRNPVQ